jgi:hypothetical protein
MLALGAVQTAIAQFSSLALEQFDLDGPALVRLVRSYNAAAPAFRAEDRRLCGGPATGGAADPASTPAAHPATHPATHPSAHPAAAP